jgi:hypothetical protein
VAGRSQVRTKKDRFIAVGMYETAGVEVKRLYGVSPWTGIRPVSVIA